MQSLTKLFVLILVIGLPVFIFSTNKASAALQHKCGTIKGVCTVNGLAYNVKSIYNDALRQFEWKCGFGKDIINCNSSKSKSSLIPPPGKDDQNNNKGDKEQAKGDLDHYEKEYKETTTTSVTYKFCPCPTCGKEHYECSNGNPGKWSHAVEKAYSKENLDEIWHWRCTDRCGNVSVLCEERKGRDDLLAKCDESECKYETDCATCAKCKIGEPEVTTSYNGKCYWVCRMKDKDGRWMSTEDYCSADKKVESKCGPGSGTIFSPGSFSPPQYKNKIVIEYIKDMINNPGYAKSQTLDACQPGYSVCDLHKTRKDGWDRIDITATWRCCYGGCESWRKNNRNCDDCHAQSLAPRIT